MQYDLDAKHMTSAQLGIHAMFDALEKQTDNEYIDLSVPYEPAQPLTWPSTISYIETHCNGFYGLTTFAAEPGTGKTLLCTASAIEAAATGEWQVCAFVAEDDYDGFRERVDRYVEAHPGAADCFPNLHPVAVGKGQTPGSIALEVATLVDEKIDTPILVAFDSINSIVNLGDMPYLSGLGQFGRWAMMSRRISRGRVSFMMTSETNRRGEAKGESLRYWSDLYLNMKKKGQHVVQMAIGKTRRTGGEGPMGKYWRNWHKGEFESEEIQHPPLRAVGGRGDYELT